MSNRPDGVSASPAESAWLHPIAMWHAIGFRSRLILAGVGLQALALAAVVMVTSSLVEQHLREALQARIAELRPLINAALAVPMAQRDYASVAAVVRETVLMEGVDYLRVCDSEGREVAVAGRDPHLPAAAAPAQPAGGMRVFDTPLWLSGQRLGEVKVGLSLAAIEATRTAIVERISMIGTGVVIASSLLLTLLGYALTRPLRRLVQASRDISAGHYDIELATTRRDEIGVLMNAFDRMSHEVRRTVRELTDSHALAQRYLDEARSEHAQAETQKQRAEAANRAKSDFLANVSHEIRTPMNAILGFAALARESGVDERQRRYLDKVESGTRSLLGVLDDVLDYAKIEAGRLELEQQAFDPAALVAEVGELFAGQAASRGILLAMTIDDAMPALLLGDPLRLRQVLLNLVSNAVKFTEQGSVDLRARHETDPGGTGRLVVEVRDTGIGMSEAQLARVFAPFTQADSSITRRFGGTGLGLSIANRLATQMGGSLAATSQPGKGSTFTLAIPMSATQAPLPRAAAPGASSQPARPPSEALPSGTLPSEALPSGALPLEAAARARLAPLLQELVDRIEGRRLDAREPALAIETLLAGTAWQTRFEPIARAVRGLEFQTASRTLERFADNLDRSHQP
jgi:signal transduction histidine kinase